MSDTAGAGRYSYTINELTKEIYNCEFRIEETKKRKAQIEKLDRDISVYKQILDNCVAVVDQLKPFIQDITAYVSDRRNKAIESLRNAIRVAGYIIPEATSDIDITIKGDEMELSTKTDNMDVDLLEGSGFKAVLSVLLRMSILQQNPNLLTNVFLDEPFSKVSTTKSQDVIVYLPVLAQRVPLLLIEHKHEMKQMQSGDIMYHFNLVDGMFTEIEKEVYEVD